MVDAKSKQPASVQAAQLLVQQLINVGVEFVSLSPGSRNGPISLALIAAEKQGLLSVHVRIDERSASFLALGAAIKSGKPTAVLTTSGTAVANLFPAIIEAKYSGTPFIVLTADRPAAVHGTGANQVIVQREIFGSYVNRSIEIASESLNLETSSALDAIKDRINSVLSIAIKNGGPVHLNIALAEPLVPTQEFKFEKKNTVQAINQIIPENISTEFLKKKGIIVAGGTNVEYQNYAYELSQALDWPVIVEPPHKGVAESSISSPSLIISLQEIDFKPEVVLTIGRVGLSRQVSEMITSAPILISCAVPKIITNSKARQRISGLFKLPIKQSNLDWKNLWQDKGKRVFQIVEKVLLDHTKLSSLQVVNLLIKKLPKNSHIHLASSLSARDFDLLMSPEFNSPYSNGDVSVSMNRGVNGIDGVVSTAMGTALSSNQATFALLGDIAALHDLSGFVIPAGEKVPNITFIVCDNNGGGIFNLLEQSDVPDFERAFGTPTNLNLIEIFKSLKADVKSISNLVELEENLLQSAGIKVLVVKIESRLEEANLRKLLFEEIKK